MRYMVDGLRADGDPKSGRRNTFVLALQPASGKAGLSRMILADVWHVQVQLASEAA